MKIIENLIQGTPEWFAFRKGKITASMMPTIMGENPYETPLQLFDRILMNEDKEETAAMSRGKRLEPLARDWWQKVYGFKLETPVVQHDKYDWLIASLDGYNEKGSPCKLVEIKCGEKDYAYTEETDEIPHHHIAQLQFQLMITGLESIYYMAFNGEDGLVYPVKADPKYQEKILEAAKDFHKRLINFDPPEPCERDTYQVNDAQLLEETEQLKELYLSYKSFESRYEEKKKAIIEKVNHPRFQVGNVKFTKSLRKGAVEYSKIPQLEGVDLEPFRKPCVESWRVSI